MTERKPDLFMMLGYPGAGKSTASSFVEQLTGAYTLSADAIRLALATETDFSQHGYDRLYSIMNHLTGLALQQGRSVIYDANLNRYKHRVEKYDICQAVGATPRLIHITTPWDVSLENVVRRGHDHLHPPGDTAYSLFDRVAGALQTPHCGEPVIPVSFSEVTLEGMHHRLAQAGVDIVPVEEII